MCTTLLEENGQATEVIEPFSVSKPETKARLLDLIDPIFPDAYDAVLVCGAIPEGLPESTYRDLLKPIRVPIIIWDSATGLLPELLGRISWIKVNAGEYPRLLPSLGKGKPPPTLVTDGPNPAQVLHSCGADGIYPVPELTGIINPIGSGDAAAAALADGLLRKMEEEEAVRHALAVGAASCLSLTPADWDADAAARCEADMAREAA